MDDLDELAGDDPKRRERLRKAREAHRQEHEAKANGHGEIPDQLDDEADDRTERDQCTGLDAWFDTSHDGLALDMGARWRGDARYTALLGKWLFWSGKHWQVDDKLEHLTRCREFLRAKGAELIRWAEQSGDEKLIDKCKVIAKQLRSAQMVAWVVGLARSNTELVAVIGQWDANLLTLGAQMTVDLGTGACRKPNPLDYITKTAAIGPAPPGTEAPLWRAFLDKITGSNVELQAYLQRVGGYCLTGLVEEHVLFFLYGTGANGKSVFTSTLVGILKDYAVTISTDMLMVSQTDRHPTEIARLRGARLVVGSEVETRRTWAESKIKTLTGGDRLQGRFMRQDFFEFDPQFKLMVVGNNKPSLHGVDEAIRRRLHLLPFTVTIPPEERDKGLAEKLKAEWPAILRWMIEGCLDWQRQGLNPPAVVRDATETYLAAEDTFELWRADCTTADKATWESSADLWSSWKKWAEAAGEFVGTQKAFSQKLEDHGFMPQKGTTIQKARGFRGARLNRRDYTDDPRYGS